MISGPDDLIPFASKKPPPAENVAAVQRPIAAGPKAQRALGGGMLSELVAYVMRESNALRTKLYKAKVANDG